MSTCKHALIVGSAAEASCRRLAAAAQGTQPARALDRREVMMPDLTVAGIGYEGRTVEDVIARLRAAGVSRVVDVRERPWSRKPGFSKTRLCESLAAAGIAYVHLRAAGNPRENRLTAPTRAECLDRFRAHLASRPGVVKEIFTLANEMPTALLCFEADREECHRSVLLEQLASRFGPVRVVDV